jgi:hypothetical protein
MMYFIDLTQGPLTVSLPTAVGAPGALIGFKKISKEGNAITLTPPIVGQLIEQQSNVQIIFPGVELTIVSDGTNWWIL